VIHAPVMVREVVAALVTRTDGRYVDGTVGDGGHARAILDATQPSSQFLGLDRDPQALRSAGEALAAYEGRVHLAQSDFSALAEILPEFGWERVDGILLDLGLRSSALDDAERGFSFQLDGPLDMRFDPRQGTPAGELLRRIDARRLEALLAAGTTRASPRAIARAILDWRRSERLERTGDLVACLRRGLRRRATPKLLSSVFATLRMEVNRELASLDHALATMPGLLGTGGVLCVLSYQSQEDRRIKQLRRTVFRDPATRERFRLMPLGAQPQRATPEEIRQNRRARSARLRALQRIPETSAS
jgi:16S rRNA (cytosine1402-N4)-methyltransferase